MGNRIWRAMMGLVVLLLPITAAHGELTGLEYPSFGVSLIGPAGWTGRFPACKFTVATWEHRDEDTHAVQAVIEVRAHPADAMTLQQFADTVAKENEVVLVDKGLVVDGAPAWRLEARDAADGLSLRGVVVAEHEGVMYAIRGAAQPTEEWLPAVREVMARWKWTTLETPAKRMRYVDGLVKLLRGRLWISLPVGMGFAELEKGWQDSLDSAAIGLCNFKKGGDDLMMSASLEELRDGETIENFRTRWLESLGAGVKTPVEWRHVPEWPSRRETEVLKVGQGVYEQYACLEVGNERRVIALRFRIATEDEDDLAFYERQVAYMIREFYVGPKLSAEDIKHGAVSPER